MKCTWTFELSGHSVALNKAIPSMAPAIARQAAAGCKKLLSYAIMPFAIANWTYIYNITTLQRNLLTSKLKKFVCEIVCTIWQSCPRVSFESSGRSSLLSARAIPYRPPWNCNLVHKTKHLLYFVMKNMLNFEICFNVLETVRGVRRCLRHRAACCPP